MWTSGLLVLTGHHRMVPSPPIQGGVTRHCPGWYWAPPDGPFTPLPGWGYSALSGVGEDLGAGVVNGQPQDGSFTPHPGWGYSALSRGRDGPFPRTMVGGTRHCPSLILVVVVGFWKSGLGEILTEELDSVKSVLYWLDEL